MLMSINANQSNASVISDLLQSAIDYLMGLEPFSDWAAPSPLQTTKDVDDDDVGGFMTPFNEQRLPTSS